MKPIRHLILFSLLATGLAAQQKIVYADGDPNPASGSRNAFPFGSVGIRYQAIFPHSLFGSSALNIVTIRDILISGSVTVQEANYEDIEIKMGLTTAATVGTDWNTNNPNPKTVYRGPLKIRMTPATWGGIGLPNSYLYLPLAATDNLCVEVIVWRADSHAGNFYFPMAASTLQRAFRYQWTTNQTLAPLTGTSGCRMGFVLDNGNISNAGVSCKSSAGTVMTTSASNWPEVGKSLKLGVAGAQQSTVGFYIIGTKPLCYDLKALNAPGCIYWNDDLVIAAVVSDAAGTASVTIPSVPTGAGTLLSHFLFFDRGANTAGIATSDMMTVIMGR